MYTIKTYKYTKKDRLPKDDSYIMLQSGIVSKYKPSPRWYGR